MLRDVLGSPLASGLLDDRASSSVAAAAALRFLPADRERDALAPLGGSMGSMGGGSLAVGCCGGGALPPPPPAGEAPLDIEASLNLEQLGFTESGGVE